MASRTLTEARCRAANDVQLPDAQCPGLRLHAGAHRKAWVYRYRDAAGKLKQVQLGLYPAMSLQEAREAWRLASSRKASGQAPLEQQGTLGSVCDLWATRCRRERSPKAAKEVERLLAKVPWRGEAPASLARSTAAQWLAQQKPSMHRAIARELKAAWAYAQDQGVLSDSLPSPFERLRTPPQRARSRVLDKRELTLLLDFLEHKQPVSSFRDVATLMLLTCCRSGELVAAKTEHIDLQQGTLLLPTTKTGLPRVVQLSTHAVRVIARRIDANREVRRQNSSYLFPSPAISNAPIQQKAIGLALWDSFCPVTFRIHDLRRTAATHIAELGLADSDLVELLLGHSRQGVRGIYNRSVRSAEQKATLQAWGDWLMEHCAV